MLGASMAKHSEQRNIPPIAVSSEEAARIMGIAPKTLVNWRHCGKGPAYVRLGEKHSPVMYRVCDIESWLADHVVGSKKGRR